MLKLLNMDARISSSTSKLNICLVCVVILFHSDRLLARDSEANKRMTLFEQFTRGEIPIREAVVYREAQKPDGTVFNREWVKFSFQAAGATYYIQRLAPSTNDPSKLVSAGANRTWGASMTHLWVITDTDVHVVEKTVAAGSGPKQNSDFGINFMEGAISLGIPHTALESLSWRESAFTTEMAQTGLNGEGVRTNRIFGERIVNEAGYTLECRVPKSGSFEAEEIIYAYNGVTNGLPSSFKERVAGGGDQFVWTFLSLELGQADLNETAGYVPTMFAAANLVRHPTIWTNQHSYTVFEAGTAPDFKAGNPQGVARGVFAGCALAVITISALWLRRWKRR